MFNFKKKFGQNFLINEHVLRTILNSVPENANEIYEIGPGSGNLTKFLLTKFKVHAIEIDKECVEELQKLNCENLKISCFDVLNFRFEKMPVVGNLPYNIASKILSNFVYSPIPFGVFMLQKEMADLLLLKENSRLGFFVNAKYSVEKVINVSASSFVPKPKVESTVVALKEKDVIFDYVKYHEFLKIIFMHKRKKLAFLKNYSKEIFDLFEKNNLLEKRIDELKFELIFDLFNRVL